MSREARREKSGLIVSVREYIYIYIYTVCVISKLETMSGTTKNDPVEFGK